MKKILALATIVLCTAACINDDSDLPIKEISNISIFSPSDTINVDYGFELSYEPDSIKQTIDGVDLSYEWAYQSLSKNSFGSVVLDSLKVISNERVLKHTFKKLGEYRLRLKVSNQYGSSFKQYVLMVQAPFDSGLLVLSADNNKKGRVSFLRPLTREEIVAGKKETFHTDALSQVNPNIVLRDPGWVEKIGPDIFITSIEEKKVYRVDSKTFELYNITNFEEDTPGTIPTRILSKDRSITNYFVVNANGGLTQVNYKSDIAFDGSYIISENPIIDKVFTKITNEFNTFYMRCYHYMLNYETSTLYYNFDLRQNCQKYTYTGWDLINVCMDDEQNDRLIVQSKNDPTQIRIYRGYCMDASGALMYGDYYTYNTDEMTLTRESMIQTNNTYRVAFYNNRNKLYRWNHQAAQPKFPTIPIIELDEQCEITCFDFDPDYYNYHQEIYVGVYDPRLPGKMKGCVYVYHADQIDESTGQLKLLRKYEGIADRPIRVFWKNNKV